MKMLIGKDGAFKALLRHIKVIAPSDANVLITGETGTGKELVANVIQKYSTRSGKAFIRLNCATLPESIIESELFGYVKGSFTGAESDKLGLFAAADGGTLFLDNVNSLSLSAQAKLLRFLESGEYTPVGKGDSCYANIRVICATNCNLLETVRTGDFRKDLYYRLSGIPIEIPPLRDRKGDIKLLITHFTGHFANKHAVRTPMLSEACYQQLESYRWPGNVRELRNLCEHLSIARIRKTIETHDLPNGHLIQPQLDYSPIFKLPEQGICWHELEASLICQALSLSYGNYKNAAKLLGISRNSLYYRAKKLNHYT